MDKVARKRSGIWRLAGCPVFARGVPFVLAVVSSGCFSVPMGREVFRKDHPEGIHFTAVPPTETVENLKPSVSPGEYNRNVSVGLSFDLRTTKEKEMRYKTAIVEKRKRLAVGFFPGTAESDNVGDQGKLVPLAGLMMTGPGEYRVPPYDQRNVLDFLGDCILSLPYSLLGAPFDSWEYHRHHWGGSKEKMELLDILTHFSPEERRKIGCWTWRDAAEHPQRPSSYGAHCGLFGFHKYCSYVLKDEPSSKTTPAEPEITVDNRKAAGPYSVFLHLPDLGYAKVTDVAEGGAEAVFDLLSVADGRPSTTGSVRFLPPPGGLETVEDPIVRSALEKCESAVFPIALDLPAPSMNATGADCEIRSITPLENGRYEVHLHIADWDRRIMIGKGISTEVRRLIRNDFLAKRPGSEAKNVRETLGWREDGDRQELIIDGWAFLAVPVLDGWRYDHATRKGGVRFRMSDGLPEQEALRWIQGALRETILAIVSDKNVVVQAFEKPPPGSLFKVTDGNLSEGVLDVSFQAIQ